MSTERDFNTISPSAGALLMMKALTDIPFARETAEMVGDLPAYKVRVEEKRSKVFLGRMIHFENRYKTIDRAIEAIAPKNILELSSGFSCRSLAMTLHSDITYIDTDLPEFIANKSILINRLIRDNHLDLTGSLHIEPLNAMNATQFNEVVELFTPGSATVVNEGLLVYLDDREKRQLCATIYDLLKARGGYWVTGDIYIKRTMHDLTHRLQQEAFDEELTKFLDEHRIEENKFESYEEAEAFFSSCGFAVVRKIDTVFDSLSSLQYIPYAVQQEQVKEWMRGRETWVLEAV
jgi:O-methyltransferase involved in polyketide biosynthesis